MTKRILSFGEMLWDLLPDGAVLGGAPFNFAYRAGTLGDDALIVTALGRDDEGERAAEAAGALGLDLSLVQRNERPTGTVRVMFDEGRAPDYHIVPGVAYDHVEATDEVLTAAARADCICFGTLAQRREGARSTLHRLLDAAPNALTVLDINLRKECYTAESIASSLERARVLKLNDEEVVTVAALFDLPANPLPQFCEAIVDRYGLSHCVVTLAERGAVALAKGEDAVYVPGFRVELADPLGAGDAFTAGFVHRLLRGRTPWECCELGNALGAAVAELPGATGELVPGRVEALLDGRAERIVDETLSVHAV